MDPYRIRRAVFQGKRLLIVAGVVGLALGFFVAKFVMISPYETTAFLKYEGDLDVPGLPPTRDALGPAALAIYHQPVLEKIREQSDFEGPLTQLAASLAHRVDNVSRTMMITVGHETSQGAAEYVRLVTDVFLNYHKDRQSRRLEGELSRVQHRIEAAEREAEIARERYDEFRERHGIADLSSERESTLESAADIRADSELAATEVRALEAEVASLEAQLAATPKTALVSSTGSPERTTYNRLREELASARATLSEDHPRVQSLKEQVSRLRTGLGSGLASGDGIVGVNVAYQTAEARLHAARSRLAATQARQRGLLDLAEKASDRVDSFSDVEGQAAGLLAEVRVNEALLQNLRRTQTAIEDAMQDPPSGFIVLEAGAVPEYPVRNKMKVVVFGAIPLLILGLALLVVLRREFRGLAPLTPAEIAFWGNGPVLGATAWPDDPAGFEELVAGLDDLVPDARGSVLFVAGSDTEASLTSELAGRMRADWLPVRGAQAGHAPGPETIITAAPRPANPYPASPYPVGGSRSVALATIPTARELQRADVVTGDALQLEAWQGPPTGQALRRAARLADRVVVLVRAGALPVNRLHETRRRIGREHGVGYIVLGLPPDLLSLPDRIGNVASFWGVPTRRR